MEAAQLRAEASEVFSERGGPETVVTLGANIPPNPHNRNRNSTTTTTTTTTTTNNTNNDSRTSTFQPPARLSGAPNRHAGSRADELFSARVE